MKDGDRPKVYKERVRGEVKAKGAQGGGVG